jgi:hypothetical protein
LRSHVDDLKDGSRTFSRDCSLLLLINHLKSKGFGTQADSNARRRRQAERVREIYDAHR